MIIRPATIEDLDAITDCNVALACETEKLKLDPSTVRAGVRALLDDPVKGRYYIAEMDRAFAGQTMITYEWSDWRNGPIWWLQSVYVRPEYRGRGAFRALLDRILLDARAHGAPALRLYMDEHNENARAAYQRLGLSQNNYVVLERTLSPS